ncbi:MAG TPA: arsenite efflux transporter metallochaperone ArsD [Clostridia bacterium]|nr:arsenite efflux transporter metallochaperone ArsD [Clostridia bacterium]
MKRMVIFEPAMCCSTGVCGPSVDPELLRISTVINNLKNNGILVERYNLSSNPQIFIDSKEINRMLINNGIEVLPVSMVDGTVVKTKAYPTNEEICKFLGVTEKYLKGTVARTAKGCGSSCG